VGHGSVIVRLLTALAPSRRRGPGVRIDYVKNGPSRWKDHITFAAP